MIKDSLKVVKVPIRLGFLPLVKNPASDMWDFMKDFIRIVESHWMDDKKKMMIHKDERGRLLVGKPINAHHGRTIAVELSNGLIDGHYRIINVIKILEK